MIKYCPYCTKPLGFISLVKQRLFAKHNAPLICDKCGSTISLSGSAKLGLVSGGGACGYFWGQMLGEFLPNDWFLIISGVVVAVIVTVLLAYLLAPIKTG
jgi:hypothetical protein